MMEREIQSFFGEKLRHLTGDIPKKYRHPCDNSNGTGCFPGHMEHSSDQKIASCVGVNQNELSNDLAVEKCKGSLKRSGLGPGRSRGKVAGGQRLLGQLLLFKNDVFAGFRVELFDFQLIRVQLLVFGSRVKIAGAGGRFQFDEFAHNEADFWKPEFAVKRKRKGPRGERCSGSRNALTIFRLPAVAFR